MRFLQPNRFLFPFLNFFQGQDSNKRTILLFKLLWAKAFNDAALAFKLNIILKGFFSFHFCVLCNVYTALGALKGKELGYSFHVCYLKGKPLLGRW